MKKQTTSYVSKFSRFASVLSEGFTEEDATPPNIPMMELAKGKYPKTIEYEPIK